MMHNERGFTLAEILVAAVIIAVGIVGLAVVMPLAGYGVQQGNQVSTATFLAQQKLELVRNATWTGALYPSPLPAGWTAPIDCVGTSSGNAAPTSTTCNVAPCATGTSCTTFSDESSSAITGYAGYSRTVRVTDCGVGAGCGASPNAVVSSNARLAVVTVTFTPSTGVGAAASGQTFTVSLDLMVSQR
jgi:prepilin-type N-terminal cleavage/methylation domain-containing protein